MCEDGLITGSTEKQKSRAPRRDAALNKTRLVEAARRMLAESPQTGMATISKAAGFAPNTIYRHFPTRQDLLEAVRRQASDDSAAGDDDYLRPPGELANVSPTPLSVWDILNKVPPFQLGIQIVAEAQRLTGVTSAAIYLIDLDGHQLRRLAGPENFPAQVDIELAVGPEIPREVITAVRSAVDEQLPGTTVAPLYLRGRATGVLLAIGSAEDELRELAQEAAAALAVAERYTDLSARVRRSRPTSPAAELQQNLLPPRIVRIGGAMLAGNVLPGYEIGGDWFDYTDNPEHAWLGIADTEGNGPRAAATGAIILAAFRSARHLENATPASASHLMHQTLLQLADHPPTASSTIATWNGATALFQWVTCGQFPPILIDAHGDLHVLGERQPDLGATDFPKHLRIQSQRLTQGERILLASDGILHRTNGDGDQFGLLGVKAAIDTAPETSAPTTLRAIEDAAQAFSDTPLTDDATLMVLAPSATPLAAASPRPSHALP